MQPYQLIQLWCCTFIHCSNSEVQTIIFVWVPSHSVVWGLGNCWSAYQPHYNFSWKHYFFAWMATTLLVAGWLTNFSHWRLISCLTCALSMLQQILTCVPPAHTYGLLQLMHTYVTSCPVSDGRNKQWSLLGRQNTNSSTTTVNF